MNTASDNAQLENGLPAGWVWTTLGEATEVILGQSPPSSTYNSDGIGLPFFQGKAEFGNLYPTVAKWCSEPSKIAEADDVLISVRAPVGPTNLSTERCCIGRGLAAIKPVDGMLSRYILYYLRYIEHEWDSKATGTTFKAISGDTLRRQAFPLAPLPEQHRIVAEIETQFSRLDAGVAALKRAQGNLRRYRASVLKAACQGRLVPTEAELARGEGRAYESGAALLTRILAERRARWEQANPGKRYVEPKAPEVDGLAELPEGWVWTDLEQLSWDAGYGTSQKCGYDAKGPPVIRIPNLVNGSISTADLKYATQPDDLRQENSLAANDLLIIRTNGSKDLIGRSALVRQRPESDFFYASYLIRYRLLNIGGTARWSAAIWDSALLRRQIEQVAATTAGQYNVSVRVLNRLVIPLPPLAEQHRIVAEVERRLSVAQEVEGIVAAGLRRAERLRQSILKQAFAGRLTSRAAGVGA